MLIIFDLDDTLIDTSACITPIKLNQALYRMIEAGCEILDVSSCFKKLLEFNDKSNSAKEALEKFIEFMGFKKKFLQIGVHEVYSTPYQGIKINPVEGALELLLNLKGKCFFALVSMGKLEQQMSKLEKAGIDSSLFYKIFILEEGSKKKCYQELMEELRLLPSEVIVCGDRIPVDLAPAKELGCVTVHMKRGRGVLSQESGREVDFVITEPSQLQEIFFKISDGKIFNGVSSGNK